MERMLDLAAEGIIHGVEVRPVAQQRIYSLRAEPFKELDVWLERYRRIVEDRFGRLDEILRDQKEKGDSKRGNNK